MANARLQFDTTQRGLDEIDALMKACGLEKKKDFFNNAIAIFKWVINETKTGRIVSSIDEQANTYRVLTMPILSNVEPEPSKRTTPSPRRRVRREPKVG